MHNSFILCFPSLSASFSSFSFSFFSISTQIFTTFPSSFLSVYFLHFHPTKAVFKMTFIIGYRRSIRIMRSKEEKEKNRLALKGFEWIEESHRCTPVNTPVDKSFKNFKVLVEKKKWKKKSYKTFDGFEGRIQAVIEDRLEKGKDKFEKEKRNIFLKKVEYMRVKNEVQKVWKMKKVEKIRCEESEFTKKRIQNYLKQQNEWARKRFSSDALKNMIL